MESRTNLFKILFWIMTAFVLLLIAGVMLLIPISSGPNMSGDDQVAFGVMMIAAFFSIIVVAIIGIIVFKDAKKLGMNEWLWILVVIYVPNGLGIIIYLIMRSSEKKKRRCIKCSEPIDPNFALCPHCGHKLKESCPSCDKAIESEWKVCPYCSSQLK